MKNDDFFSIIKQINTIPAHLFIVPGLFFSLFIAIMAMAFWSGYESIRGLPWYGLAMIAFGFIMGCAASVRAREPMWALKLLVMFALALTEIGFGAFFASDAVEPSQMGSTPNPIVALREFISFLPWVIVIAMLITGIAACAWLWKDFNHKRGRA